MAVLEVVSDYTGQQCGCIRVYTGQQCGCIRGGLTIQVNSVAVLEVV